MKNILFILFLFIYTNAYADVYVMYNGVEITGISEKDDMVLEPGSKITILKDIGIKDLGIIRPVEHYLFKNNKFVLNTSLINELEDAQIKQARKTKELQRIERKQKKMAYEALKSEGVVFKEIVDEEFNE